MKEYISVIKNYAIFQGRARRREYWMFTLFNVIFFFGTEVLDRIIGDTFNYNGISLGFGYIYVVYALFVFIPGLAVAVRRLHDVGKSGWLFVILMIVTFVVFGLMVAGFNTTGLLLLIALILFGGWIWLLVLFCTDSAVGPNKYGANPKGVGDIDEFDFMKTTDTES